MKKALSLTSAILLVAIFVMLASMLVGCKKKNENENNIPNDNTQNSGYVLSGIKYTVRENGKVVNIYNQKVLFNENNRPYKGDLTSYVAKYGENDSIEEYNDRYITELTYDNSGRVIKQNDTSWGGAPISFEYVYDANGNIIEENKVYPGYSEKYLYAFNSDGKLVSEKRFHNDVERSHLTLTYDNYGNVIERRHETDSGYELAKYVYDNGRLIEESRVLYGKDGKQKSNKFFAFYEYDDEGNLIFEKASNDGGATIFKVCSYVYENGKLVHEEYQHSDGVDVKHYTYDSKGNLIKSEIDNHDGDKYTKECTYDNKGNEVRCVVTYENGYKLEYENTFDSEGRMISKHQWTSDGSEYYYNNVFDTHGNLVKIEEIYIDDGMRREEITEYEYVSLSYDITEDEMYDLIDLVCWFGF